MIEVVNYHERKYDAAVKVKIDLTLYIQSLEKYIQNQDDKYLIEDVRKEYNEAFLNFHGINGALLWDQIISELFNTSIFSADEIQKIKASPLFMHFKNFAGIEIVKNAADECLFRFFSPQEKMPTYTIELFFKLKVNSDNIIFDIHDTGRGFPDSLLELLSSTDGLCHYLLQDGSFKTHPLDVEKHKNFRIFGGCGIGLRELISYVKFSESLAEINKKALGLSALPLSEKIRILGSQMIHLHQLVFANSASGAEIKLLMPKLSKQEDFQAHKMDVPEKQMVLQLPKFFRLSRDTHKQDLPEREFPRVFATP